MKEECRERRQGLQVISLTSSPEESLKRKEIIGEDVKEMRAYVRIYPRDKEEIFTG